MGVILRHEVTGAVIETTAIGDDGGKTQAELHQTNGWVPVDQADVDEAVTETGQAGDALLRVLEDRLRDGPPPDAPLDTLKKDELLKRAEAADVEIAAKATKADIIDALTSAPDTEES